MLRSLQKARRLSHITDDILQCSRGLAALASRQQLFEKVEIQETQVSINQSRHIFTYQRTHNSADTPAVMYAGGIWDYP